MVVFWQGDALASAARKAAIKAIQRDAEIIKGLAVEKAPIDEGPLRNSATVTDTENGAEISFNTPYALVMHEWQGYTPQEPGTGPGYLRQPLLENLDLIQKDVTKAIRSVL